MLRTIESKMIINLTDHRKFLYAIEPAEFLFGADVWAYLREIRELIVVLYAEQEALTTQNSYGEDMLALSPERATNIETVGSLYARRNEVFRSYLMIHDE